MAGTLTTYNSENLAIERDPVKLVFEYEAEVGLTKSEEVVLRALPAGCKILGIQVHCIQADAGTATSQLSIDYDPDDGASTEIFTGTADNGATVNTLDGGTAGSDGAFLPSVADGVTDAAGNLIGSFTGTGTTTTGAKYRILIDVFRPSF